MCLTNCVHLASIASIAYSCIAQLLVKCAFVGCLPRHVSPLCFRDGLTAVTCQNHSSLHFCLACCQLSSAFANRRRVNIDKNVQDRRAPIVFASVCSSVSHLSRKSVLSMHFSLLIQALNQSHLYLGCADSQSMKA